MMDKEEAKEKMGKLVKEFLEYSKDEINKKSENQIKSEFIDPLFECLGWDMRKDAEREERILKGRADYIMRIGNQDKLVIEAKKTNVGLNEEEGRQAVSYAHHKNIKFAVLTNFKQIRFYHALSNIKNIDKNLLKDDKDYLRFNCEDFVKDFDRLWLLSRESFEKEEINKLLKNVEKKLIKPIDESILVDLLQYRKWLSTDLKSKRVLEDSQIDEIVQILIDRLIFMRSVEDRDLEAHDFLLKIINDVEKGFTDMNLWAVLKTQFQRFDKTYNSKLFQEGILEKEGFFDNKILVKVIRGLYYGTQDHQERYRFDDLPVDLLGSIYEQYLGVVLRGTEKRVKLDLVSGKRKKMGIYYTPSYIVDYIVKNTIEEYVKGKSLDEILDIKILDCACGSGSFLIKAFQELINIIEERLKKGEKSQRYQNTFQEWKGKLSLGEKSTILLNCIHGVDLDEKAVELAQLNLLLKILEEETRETRRRILPNMKDNIKNGNSLISDSSFEKAFNWDAQFPDVFRKGGFDVVVGNPPYVDSEEMVKTQPKTRDYCNKNYETAKGNWDIFGIFIEKGLRLLKEGGMFGMIVPNKLLSAKYTETLRDFIENKKQIISIRDYSKISVFSASVYPIVIIIKNDFNDNNKLLTEVMESDGENIKLKESNTIKQKDLINSSEKTWAYIFEKEGRKMLDKILKNSKPLDELSNVSGSATVSEAYEIKKYLKELSNNKDYFKFINTGTIDRYSILWESFKTQYIEDSYIKPIILKKDLEKISKKRVSESENPKIVIAGMTKLLECCIDERGEHLAGKSTTLVIPKSVDIKIILAILNSKLITFVYKNLFKSLSLAGGYIRVGPPQIKILPIKLPSPSQAKRIKELVERIMQFHKEGKSEQQIKNIDYEIDEEVYKLYKLTPEEIKIIEDNLK